jgi:hypothetical protein
MSPLHIGVIVYVATFMTLGLWSLAIARKRAGALMTNFLGNREEIARLLKAGAVSPWDPFHPQGAKRWRLILFIEFGILVVLNFATL